MKKPKLIKYKATKSSLSIVVPISLLGHLAKTHPEGPYKVKNFKTLAQEVLEEILQEDSDTGHNKFETLIEEIIYDVAESASENLYTTEDL